MGAHGQWDIRVQCCSFMNQDWVVSGVRPCTTLWPRLRDVSMLLMHTINHCHVQGQLVDRPNSPFVRFDAIFNASGGRGPNDCVGRGESVHRSPTQSFGLLPRTGWSRVAAISCHTLAHTWRVVSGCSKDGSSGNGSLQCSLLLPPPLLPPPPWGCTPGCSSMAVKASACASCCLLLSLQSRSSLHLCPEGGDDSDRLRLCRPSPPLYSLPPIVCGLRLFRGWR